MLFYQLIDVIYKIIWPLLTLHASGAIFRKHLEQFFNPIITLLYKVVLLDLWKKQPRRKTFLLLTFNNIN